MRRRLADELHIGIAELDALLAKPQQAPVTCRECPPTAQDGPGSTDDMIRRGFLRAIAVTSALAALPANEAEALGDAQQRCAPGDFAEMNEHLWRIYRLARSKNSIYPLVQEQLASLATALRNRPGTELRSLWRVAGDLFQLAGELGFDNGRYADAAASYTLAASASEEAEEFDLWACALVRHAYVDMSAGHYGGAEDILSVAEKVAARGDSQLPTRQWIAAVRAEAHAGLGNATACERSLAEAEEVVALGTSRPGNGWLRFDGSRLAEERGARLLQLGRLDRAEAALTEALHSLPRESSYRRRVAVLADLAAVGAMRRDPDQVTAFGHQALRLARESSSGYAARRLQGLRDRLSPFTGSARVAELGAEISRLNAAQGK